MGECENRLTFFEKQDIFLKYVRQRHRAGKLHKHVSRYIINHQAFAGVNIEGEQRIGKSSLALQCSREIYGNWEDVFKYLVFSKDQFVNLLDGIEKTGIRVPLIVWDDVGINASAASYFEDPDLVRTIKQNIDLIGTLSKSLIVTTPDADDLIKPIRRLRFLKILVTPDRFNEYANCGISYDNRRTAIAWKTGRSPLGSKWASREFIDVFDKRMPDNIYLKYAELRTKLNKDAIKRGKENMTVIERAEDERAEEMKEKRRQKAAYLRKYRAGETRIRMKDDESED